MAIDPVCKMQVDEKRLRLLPSTRVKNITSAPWAAKRLSTRNRRNTSPRKVSEGQSVYLSSHSLLMNPQLVVQ